MHSWCVETLWTWRRTQWRGRTWWRPSTQQFAYATCSWEGPCEDQEKASAAPKVQHIFTSWTRSREMGAAANRLRVAFLLLSGTDDVGWSGSSDYTALAKGLRGFIRRAGCITSPRSKLPLCSLLNANRFANDWKTWPVTWNIIFSLADLGTMV